MNNSAKKPPRQNLFNDSASFISLIKMKMVEKYIADLSDPNSNKRMNAAKQLGIYYDLSALPHLVKSLQDEDERVVEQAIYSLGVFGREDTVEPIIECLNSKSEAVKFAAIKVLGEMQTNLVITPFGKLLKDSNPKIRMAAAKSIGQIGDKKGLFYLIDAINDPDPEVVYSIIIALTQIKDKEAIPSLIQQLDNPSDEIKYVSALALGKFKDDRIVNPLIKLSHSINPKLRLASIVGLKLMGDQQAVVNTFIKALEDEDPYVKQAAAYNLAELKNPKTAEFFIDKLRSGEAVGMKITAAKALGTMRISSAVPVLIDILDHEDASLVAECIKALIEIKDQTATKHLVKLFSHPDEKIQILSLKAIGKIELSVLLQFNFKEKVKKAVSFMYLVPIKAKSVKKYSDPIRIAAFEALGRIYFGKGEFLTAYKHYQDASEIAPIWENMKFYYQAHANAAILFDMISKGKYIDILKSKKIREMIDLYNKAGRMVNVRLLSAEFWPVVESYCELYSVEQKAKGREKEEFNAVFTELMQRLSQFDQKFPKDHKEHLTHLFSVMEELIKLTTKSGKGILDISTELAQAENDLFKIAKFLILNEPDDLKFGIASEDKGLNTLADSIMTQKAYINIEKDVLSIDAISETEEISALVPRMEKKYEVEIEDIETLESDRTFGENTTIGTAQMLRGEYKLENLIENSYEYLIKKEYLKETVVKDDPIQELKKSMKKYFNNELIDKYFVFQFKKDALNGVKGKVVGFLDDARLEDCSFVIFPENTMMSEYVPKLQHFADFYNIIVIFGEEHVPGGEGFYINRIGVVFPHRSTIRYINKNKPEQYDKKAEFISQPKLPQFKVFRSPMGTFMVFHGNDYRAYNEYIDHLIREYSLDFIIILANNYWTEEDLNGLFEKSLEKRIPIIFSNTAVFGGSNIYPLNPKGLKSKSEAILIQKWPKERIYDLIKDDKEKSDEIKQKEKAMKDAEERFKQIF